VGLTSSDALSRLSKYGRNADAEARESGLIVSLGRRLLEPMCLILIAAAAVLAGTGDAPSALIILVILGVSVTLDTVQEGSAKRAAEALRQSVAVKAEVKREGTFVSVDVETVVPGDVFRVGVGDIIPADALVLEANAFTANEAALTGEPYASSSERPSAMPVSGATTQKTSESPDSPRTAPSGPPNGSRPFRDPGLGKPVAGEAWHHAAADQEDQHDDEAERRPYRRVSTPGSGVLDMERDIYKHL
jgi:hypothetical protein